MQADSSGGSTAAHPKHRSQPVRDRGTLQELWRFKNYAGPERRALYGGVAMRGLELAANLAAPWPLALVINDLLKGQGGGGALHAVAEWFGGSAVAMLSVAAVAVLVITAASGLFDYLGDVMLNGAGERITSRIRADVFDYTERLPMTFHDRQTVGELTSRVVSDTSQPCPTAPSTVRVTPVDRCTS